MIPMITVTHYHRYRIYNIFTYVVGEEGGAEVRKEGKRTRRRKTEQEEGLEGRIRKKTNRRRGMNRRKEEKQQQGDEEGGGREGRIRKRQTEEK